MAESVSNLNASNNNFFIEHRKRQTQLIKKKAGLDRQSQNSSQSPFGGQKQLFTAGDAEPTMTNDLDDVAGASSSK